MLSVRGNKYLYQPNQSFNTHKTNQSFNTHKTNQSFNTHKTYYNISLINLLFASRDQGPKLNSITLYYTVSATTKWIKEHIKRTLTSCLTPATPPPPPRWSLLDLGLGSYLGLVASCKIKGVCSVHCAQTHTGGAVS